MFLHQKSPAQCTQSTRCIRNSRKKRSTLFNPPPSPRPILTAVWLSGETHSSQHAFGVHSAAYLVLPVGPSRRSIIFTTLPTINYRSTVYNDRTWKRSISLFVTDRCAYLTSARPFIAATAPAPSPPLPYPGLIKLFLLSYFLSRQSETYIKIRADFCLF